MELQSISRISKQFNVSARTLRYYEQIGLIKPAKTAGLTRIYDEDTVMRLKQIIVLRKLRIPLKQISEILDSGNIAVAIETFQQNLTEIENEINALSSIKNVIQSLLEIVDSVTASKINFKEEKVIMNVLNKANKQLNKLTDRDVRIIYLPPATVASIHHIGCSSEGEIPESTTGIMMRDFIRNNNLAKIKPDLRHYGFNHPDKPDNGKEHGYERWVTISRRP